MKKIYAKTKNIYLGIGTNLGNRKKSILKSLYLLNKHKIRVIKKSSIYVSPPWGYINQKAFYNAVVLIKTNKKPKELLKICQQIEKKMGKRKRFKWGPRIIDIDILTYKNKTKHTKILTIPHKYITQRMFTLVPLAEIDKNIRLNGQTLEYFINGLNDKIKPVKS